MALLAAPARAFGDDNPAPDQILNPVAANSDPIIAGAVAAADAYWTRVYEAPLCPAQVFLYDDVDPEANARGDQPGCRIWITRRIRTSVARSAVGAKPRELTRAAWRTFARQTRRMFLVAFCDTVTHERGHNLGLTHDSGWPVMHPNRDPLADAPPECREWAASIEPRVVTYTHAVKRP